MVEHLTCNEAVAGSTPAGGSFLDIEAGEVPEWPKGTDCKSVGEAFGGSNPPLPTTTGVITYDYAGVTQLARVTAFQAVGRGFESRLPLFFVKWQAVQPVKRRAD